MCPKFKPASKQMVEFATSTSVSDYNVANCLVDSLGIQLTTSIYKCLKDKETRMDSPYRRKMRNRTLAKDLDYGAAEH